MDPREILHAACVGATLAVAIRWILRLDVDLHWAVCIGAVSLLLEPWLSLHFGPIATNPSISHIAFGALLASAFLGAAESVHR